MTINPEIRSILTENSVSYQEGIVYLLAVHFGFQPNYIPANIINSVNATGIIYLDRYNSLQWSVPLFLEDTASAGTWDWVKNEYVELFKQANTEKRGNANQCVRLMKQFFAKYSDIRKHEVLEATKMYIASTDHRYIRQSNYFIRKGRGVELTEDLKEWVERYRESVDASATKQNMIR